MQALPNLICWVYAVQSPELGRLTYLVVSNPDQVNADHPSLLWQYTLA